jgi:hypothetical protein
LQQFTGVLALCSAWVPSARNPQAGFRLHWRSRVRLNWALLSPYILCISCRFYSKVEGFDGMYKASEQSLSLTPCAAAIDHGQQVTHIWQQTRRPKYGNSTNRLITCTSFTHSDEFAIMSRTISPTPTFWTRGHPQMIVHVVWYALPRASAWLCFILLDAQLMSYDRHARPMDDQIVLVALVAYSRILCD